ncbi:hypothetical protein BJF86_16235 [Serinicoccus sp. CNJ-927]|nr:hypothetical protein BJF86_16235 [Serinicoccus sp. CNJ-927]
MVSVKLVAQQAEVESAAFGALREWVAEVLGRPVYGLISYGGGKGLRAQMSPGQTAQEARASQLLLGIVVRDDFGPDGPAGEREYVVETVPEVFRTVTQIGIKTVRDGVTGLTLHISLVPRVDSDGLHPSLEWWRERTARLQADIQELGH